MELDGRASRRTQYEGRCLDCVQASRYRLGPMSVSEFFHHVMFIALHARRSRKRKDKKEHSKRCKKNSRRAYPFLLCFACTVDFVTCGRYATPLHLREQKQMDCV